MMIVLVWCMRECILDACCGARMMWFDKENPCAIFMDCREVEATLCDGRKLVIRPDVVVFKWNEEQVRIIDVLKLAPVAPLFGQRAGKTHWLVFMKGGEA